MSENPLEGRSHERWLRQQHTPLPCDCCGDLVKTLWASDESIVCECGALWCLNCIPKPGPEPYDLENPLDDIRDRFGYEILYDQDDPDFFDRVVGRGGRDYYNHRINGSELTKWAELKKKFDDAGKQPHWKFAFGELWLGNDADTIAYYNGKLKPPSSPWGPEFYPHCEDWNMWECPECMAV